MQQNEFAYTANLLGNIRSNIQSLQGYDTMALELIQNADDAKAEEIVFDVQEKGLLIRNSADFSFCGDLNNSPCPFFEERGENCDFHRITDFGSGGKLANSENIGRFGIGFSSTYQITDNPEILSSNYKVKLLPEHGKVIGEHIEHRTGTTFFLPWANNPNSLGRTELAISHITLEHIERLILDLKDVLKRSLLFLRNVKSAKLLNKGELRMQ